METVDLQRAREEKASAEKSSVAYRRFSEIQAEPIHWLWRERIACGKITMLSGDPGLGKSQLTAYMAAKVSTGGQWPDKTPCITGSVIFLNAEDDPADTSRPRLEAAGADLTKVYVLDAVKETEGGKSIQRCFNLKTDLERLGEFMKKIGDVALVIIDPITAYMSGTDSYKNSDVRALLAPLSDLASKYKAAMVCISHLNKGGSNQALMRTQGSVAFVAAARAAYIVAKDQEQPERRLFLPAKNNLGNDQTGFAFSVVSFTLDNSIQTSRIEFENNPVTVRADDALITDAGEHTVLEEAKEFLQEVCVIGRTAKQIKAQAEEAGISAATLRRAKDALGIKPKKDGKSGPWVWRLPDLEDAQGAQDVHVKNVSTFTKFEQLQTDYDKETMKNAKRWNNLMENCNE